MKASYTSESAGRSAAENLDAFVRKDNADLPGVLIYTPHLLSTVQHYVREHAVRLRRYRPVFAGRRRVEGTSVDDFPNFTFESGLAARCREFRFLLTGDDGALHAFIRRHRIKLIHAHFGAGGVEIMSLAARVGIPLVVTFHGWDVKLKTETATHGSPYQRLYRWRLPELFLRSSEMICVSECWRSRLIKLGCPAEKVHTNYLGVDNTFYDGVRGQFDPSSIIFVGRLVKQKGVHTLLQALSLLRNRGVDARLTIVGDGPELTQLQRIATEQHLPVSFLGKKTPREIRELLRYTAVLCAPSSTAGGEAPEALGLVLLEAQAMGVPVIATRNGGMPETVEDGRTGYLVDQDAPPAMAAALEALLGNEAVNRSFGQRARAFVCSQFDIDRGYRALEDLYERINHHSR